MVSRGCATDPNFPVVISQVQDNIQWKYRHIVRRAQRRVAENVSNVRLINTDDLASELVDEGYSVHFNKYGQAHIGLRIYDSLFSVAR